MVDVGDGMRKREGDDDGGCRGWDGSNGDGTEGGYRVGWEIRVGWCWRRWIMWGS